MIAQKAKQWIQRRCDHTNTFPRKLTSWSRMRISEEQEQEQEEEETRQLGGLGCILLSMSSVVPSVGQMPSLWLTMGSPLAGEARKRGTLMK